MEEIITQTRDEQCACEMFEELYLTGTAIKYADFERYPAHEIANALGISVAKVYQIKDKFQRRLAYRLLRRGTIEPRRIATPCGSLGGDSDDNQ
jgi:DNA-directed RNA polymerase specialized sigma subunit